MSLGVPRISLLISATSAVGYEILLCNLRVIRYLAPWHKIAALSAVVVVIVTYVRYAFMKHDRRRSRKADSPALVQLLLIIVI